MGPAAREVKKESKHMRPIIVKLAKMLTDCMDAKMGLVRMDESRWE